VLVTFLLFLSGTFPRDLALVLVFKVGVFDQSRNKRKLKNMSETCSICFEDLDDEVCTVDCCHQGFHSQCLQPWLMSERKCPLCRAASSACKEHASFLTENSDKPPHSPKVRDIVLAFQRKIVAGLAQELSELTGEETTKVADDADLATLQVEKMQLEERIQIENDRRLAEGLEITSNPFATIATILHMGFNEHLDELVSRLEQPDNNVGSNFAGNVVGLMRLMRDRPGHDDVIPEHERRRFLSIIARARDYLEANLEDD
jgi:hypothetical protein